MPKYVDVEPIIEEYDKSIQYLKDHVEETSLIEFANIGASFETARQQLVDAQAADVAPVRHGRWILKDDGRAHCSECDTAGNSYVWHYCPNCGARMDGDGK